MPLGIYSREEKLKAIHDMNLFSDRFMSVALNDIPACEYVLRVLTQIPSLKVIDIRTQYRANHIIVRDVVFDVLAQDAEGKLYDIEIQRADTVDHPRRIALYIAEILTEYMEKGDNVDNTPEIYVFYLSEKDIMHTHQCMSNVEKSLAGLAYDDGIHIVFANSEVKDDTDISALMQYFKKADPDDMAYGALSERVHRIKCEKGGVELMEDRTNIFFEEGKIVTSVEYIIKLAAKLSISDEAAMDILDIDQSLRPTYASYVKQLREEMATA